MWLRMGFCVWVGSGIGLGAGVTAVALLVLDVITLRAPAQVTKPDEVVSVIGASRLANYQVLHDKSQTMDVAAYRRGRARLELGSASIDATVECVTDGFFEVLGVRGPGVERFLALAVSGRQPSAILSAVTSRRLFPDRDGVPRGLVTIGGNAFTLAGVAPAGFTGVRLDAPDVWILLGTADAVCISHGDVADAALSTVGRLRAGVSVDQAAAEAVGLLSHSRTDRAATRGPLESIQEARLAYAARDAEIARWAALGALSLLMITWLNAAVLVGMHLASRRREMALRRHLGATPWGLVRMIGGEHTPTLLMAFLTGALVAASASALIEAFVPFSIPDALGNPRAIGLLGGAVVLVLSAAVLPAAARTAFLNVASALKTDESTAPRKSRSVGPLLFVHTALTFSLIMVGALLVRSVGTLWGTAGYDLDRTLLVQIDPTEAGYMAASDAHELMESLERSVRDLPGVESTALSSGDLLFARRSTSHIMLARHPDGSRPPMTSLADRSPLTSDSRILPGVLAIAAFSGVSDEYFRATGTRLLRGRSFGSGDRYGSKPVVIIDETLAEQVWQDQDPLGQCSYYRGRPGCVEIVGVVEARRHQFLTQASPEVFVPLSQARLSPSSAIAPTTLVVRSVGRVAPVADALRPLLPRRDGTRPVVAVRTLEGLATDQVRAWLMGVRLFTLSGVIGLVLGAAGLYSSLAFAAKKRTREIAIRMAIGASRPRIALMLCRETLGAVVAGVVLGGGLVGLGAQLLRSLLFGVEPLDAWALIATLALLLCGAAVGALVPTLRAVQVDPAAALRTF